MADKLFYSWADFHRDVEIISNVVAPGKYSAIHGVPRGGVPLAIALSQKLGIPLTNLAIHPYPGENVLVCDDIYDSGATRKKYPENDFVCLHGKRVPEFAWFTYCANYIQDEWVVYPWEINEVPGEDIVTRLLEFIGEDPNRPGLVETPARVIRMYKEFFQGYDPGRRPKMTKVKNGDDGVFYDEMLQDEGYFFSFCEHHIAPFWGQFYAGYIPDQWILGASKIDRIVDYHAGKLQIAERLVADIVDDLEQELQPKGIILVMRARHLCKEMRGIKKWNAPYEVRAVRGYFAENRNNCKMEFLSRIPKG